MLDVNPTTVGGTLKKCVLSNWLSPFIYHYHQPSESADVPPSAAAKAVLGVMSQLGFIAKFECIKQH